MSKRSRGPRTRLAEKALLGFGRAGPGATLPARLSSAKVGTLKITAEPAEEPGRGTTSQDTEIVR